MRLRTRGISLVVVCALAVGAVQARGGAFLFAEEGFEDTIMHPIGYDGTGGILEVTVCIDPNAVNADAIEATLLNAEARVHRHYRDIIAGPATALRPAEAPG